MVPTGAVASAWAALIGADTGTLAEATTFVAVHLAKAPFTPAPQLAIGGLTEATFTGATAIHAASAATQVSVDPATGDIIIQVREPAGGWHWATGDAVGLPQTIYGFYLTNAAGTTLLASDLMRSEDGTPTPIVLSAAGQGIDIDQVRFRLPSGYASSQG